MSKRSLSGIPFKVVWVTPPGHVITYAYDHFVWIQSSNFKTIFGKPRKQSGKKNFVKISFDSGEIRSIYRIIETAGYKGISQGFIGLSYNSLCDLSIPPSKKISSSYKVYVKPVSSFCFMLHHPDTIQRLPFLISVISFIVGLLLGLLL